MITVQSKMGLVKVLRLEARDGDSSPTKGEMSHLGILKLKAVAWDSCVGFVCKMPSGKKLFVHDEGKIVLEDLFREIVNAPDFPYGEIPANAGPVLAEMASTDYDEDSFRQLADAYGHRDAGHWSASDWLNSFEVPEGTTAENVPALVEQLLEEAAAEGITFDRDDAEEILLQKIKKKEPEEEEEEEEEEALA